MATAGEPPGDTSGAGVERVRAWTGLFAVVAGDVAIAVAAILGITHFATTKTGNAQIFPQIVAILSSAFTAIGTMTTAYFGIKSMANTANNLAGPPTGLAAPAPGPGRSPSDPRAARHRTAERQRRLRELARRRKITIPPG